MWCTTALSPRASRWLQEPWGAWTMLPWIKSTPSGGPATPARRWRHEHVHAHRSMFGILERIPSTHPLYARLHDGTVYAVEAWRVSNGNRPAQLLTCRLAVLYAKSRLMRRVFRAWRWLNAGQQAGKSVKEFRIDVVAYDESERQAVRELLYSMRARRMVPRRAIALHRRHWLIRRIGSRSTVTYLGGAWLELFALLVAKWTVCRAAPRELQPLTRVRFCNHFGEIVREVDAVVPLTHEDLVLVEAKTAGHPASTSALVEIATRLGVPRWRRLVLVPGDGVTEGDHYVRVGTLAYAGYLRGLAR